MAGSATIAAGIDRRQAILAYFTSYQDQHGVPPSMAEVAQGVGLASRTSVRHHVDQLIEAGDLVRAGAGHRSVRLAKR